MFGSEPPQFNGASLPLIVGLTRIKTFATVEGPTPLLQLRLNVWLPCLKTTLGIMLGAVGAGWSPPHPISRTRAKARRPAGSGARARILNLAATGKMDG